MIIEMQKLYTLLYIIIVGLLPLKAQTVNVEAKLDSLAIFIGEQTALHVEATVKEGQRVQFPHFQPQELIVPGIEVVEVLPLDTQTIDNNYLRIRANYLLTSFDDTLYCIPPIPVKVNGKEYMTKELALKVLDVEVDTLHPNQFFPPKDVQNNPFLWSEWRDLILLSFLDLIFFVLILVMYIRLKSNKPITLKVRIIKKIPAHQKALNSIDEIKQKSNTLTFEDAKEYYTHLTDTLRQYMQERFGFNAMEMTSAEIINRLRKEEDQQKIDELTMLFNTADLVKFAKYSAAVSENDHNLLSAVDFINTTKLENAPTEERIVPTATEQQKQIMRLRVSLKWGMLFGVVLTTALLVYVLWQFVLLVY